jgi:dynein intermediate chain 4, axonemal
MKPRARAEIDGATLLHIILTETETICLIDIPSVCVSNESTEEATAVKAANAKYKEVQHTHLS